jgi:hypothetical protein
MTYLRLFSLMFLFLIMGCGRTTPEIKGVDLIAWRDDQLGCKGVRSISIDTLTAQKKLLLGLSEMQIVDVLGKPDEQELYKRNQKFYWYLLLPGKQCPSRTTNLSSDSLKLVIRFNAVGLAKEITFE